MAIRGRPKPFYRPILKTALHRIFIEREAWFFGFFAMVIASGSALETVLRARQGLSKVGDPLIDRLFPSLEVIRQWVAQIPVISDARVITTLAIIAIVIVLVVFLGVIGQGVLLHAAKKHSKKTGVRHLVENIRPKFWSILTLDVLLKLSLGLIVLALIAPTGPTVPFFTTLLVALKSLVGFIAMLSVTIIAVYAMAALVNHNQDFRGALREGWRVFWTNIIASLEITIVLFVVSILAGMLGLLLLLLLSVPYTFLFLISASASVLATTVVTTITLFIGIAVLVTIGGLTTAYNYTVLGLAYEALRKKKFKSKIHRISKTLHWF